MAAIHMFKTKKMFIGLNLFAWGLVTHEATQQSRSRRVIQDDFGTIALITVKLRDGREYFEYEQATKLFGSGRKRNRVTFTALRDQYGKPESRTLWTESEMALFARTILVHTRTMPPASSRVGQMSPHIAIALRDRSVQDAVNGFVRTARDSDEVAGTPMRTILEFT